MQKQQTFRIQELEMELEQLEQHRCDNAVYIKQLEVAGIQLERELHDDAIKIQQLTQGKMDVENLAGETIR